MKKMIKFVANEFVGLFNVKKRNLLLVFIIVLSVNLWQNLSLCTDDCGRRLPNLLLIIMIVHLSVTLILTFVMKEKYNNES